MMYRGFLIDHANSHTKATTYYHKKIPGMKVVVNVGNKTADLYHNDKLIENT
jgi:pyruvate/2-oxoglutarate/acetoin dehydrogenase E1 component